LETKYLGKIRLQKLRKRSVGTIHVVFMETEFENWRWGGSSAAYCETVDFDTIDVDET
jgi:phenylpyruvate tautomerase PptA (4-oxalocrotonate tautomerase family)